MNPPDNGAKEEGHKDRHILPEQIGTAHRSVVREPHHEEATDNDHGPVVLHSNDYAGAENDGDIYHPDEGCNHDLEEGHDGCYSNHHWMHNPLDDMVVTGNDDGGRSEESRFVPDFDLLVKGFFFLGIVRSEKHQHQMCSEHCCP